MIGFVKEKFPLKNYSGKKNPRGGGRSAPPGQLGLRVLVIHNFITLD